MRGNRRLLAALSMSALILAAFVLPAPGNPLGTPSNDDFSSATEITALPFQGQEQTNVLATTEEGEPLCNQGAHTMWYRFTPVADMILFVKPAQSTIDLAVYKGESLGSLARLACASYGAAVNVMAEGGTTYYIQSGGGGLLGSAVTIDFQSVPGLMGHIVNSLGEPGTSNCAGAYSPTGNLVKQASADLSGNYAIGGITGDFKIRFACGSLNVSEWHNDKPDFSSGDLVSVGENQAVRINAVLNRKGTIRGTVKDESGSALWGVCVRLFTSAGGLSSGVSTSLNGTYTLPVLSPGDYAVRFGCQGGKWELEWYEDAPDQLSSTVLSVGVAEDKLGIDAVLGEAGSVSGVVTDSAGAAIYSICVQAFRPDGAAVASDWTDSSGAYEIFVSPPGDVKIKFSCSRDRWVDEWYNDKPDVDSADAVSVPAGGRIAGIDAQLSLSPPPPNDNRADAQDLSLPAEGVVDTYGATLETDEPTSCQTGQAKTVWYKFTPDKDEVVSISTEGSGYTPFIAVYEGAPSGSSTYCATYTYPRTLLIVSAKASTTYWIQFGDSDTVGGELRYKLRKGMGGEALVFNAPTPCHVQCPYWQTPTTSTDDDYEVSCVPDPASPQGSWDQREVTVPDLVNGSVPAYLGFKLDPDIDYDSFICRKDPVNGKYFVATGANSLQSKCPVLPLECKESILIAVAPGQTYILRAYNWSDGPTADGAFFFLS